VVAAAEALVVGFLVVPASSGSPISASSSPPSPAAGFLGVVGFVVKTLLEVADPLTSSSSSPSPSPTVIFLVVFPKVD
jgi:hypothetical protein